MHELPVTQTILTQAIKQAEEFNWSKIHSVLVQMGKLCSYVDESVQWYWEIVTENTIAQGSSITILRVPSSIHCRRCGHTWIPDNNPEHCMECDSILLQLMDDGDIVLLELGGE